MGLRDKLKPDAAREPQAGGLRGRMQKEAAAAPAAASDKRSPLGNAQSVVEGIEKYALKPLEMLSNMAMTGGVDAVDRLSGGKGLPREYFSDPKSLPEILTKQYKVNPMIAYPAGFIVQAKADPANMIANLTRIARPAADMIQKAAKSVYQSPFRRVTAKVAEKYKNKGSSGDKATAFVDDLWNEGKPEVGGFGKNNIEIGEQITQRRKDAWAPIQEQLEKAKDGGNIDLAPNLNESIKTARMNEALDALDMTVDDMVDPANAKKVMKLLKKLPEDADYIMKKLEGTKEQRQMALNLLQENVPDLKTVIGEAGGHLANSPDKTNTLGFFKDLMSDLAEGPRSVDGMQNLKVAYAGKAARNQAMGADQYTRNALRNPQKTADMKMAEGLGETLDDVIESRIGAEGGDALKKARATYSARRRGEWPAWQEISKAQGRQPLSKLDLLLGAGGSIAAANHVPGGWQSLLAGAAAKGIHEISRDPRLGTGTGMLLNNASKLNIWDDMLRRGAVTLGDKDE
jgi:hypothetical protein